MSSSAHRDPARHDPERDAERDAAPDDDEISDGGRADHAPTGAPGEATTGGTVRRLVTEVKEDNLTDWAASLTYYFVLAMFPALIALVSIVGLVLDPQEVTDALTQILNQVAPGTAADTFSGVIDQVAGGTATAGFGLVARPGRRAVVGVGLRGAFTRAANVVWETPEGRKIYLLKPLQLLITLIGILFVVLIALAVVATGPLTDAIGDALGLGSTATTVWDIAKWPVMVVVVAIMIAVLYYSTPNVRLRGFRWVSPGAAFAIARLARRLGPVRLLRGQLRQLQQDLRRTGRCRGLPGLAVDHQPGAAGRPGARRRAGAHHRAAGGRAASGQGDPARCPVRARGPADHLRISPGRRTAASTTSGPAARTGWRSPS